MFSFIAKSSKQKAHLYVIAMCATGILTAPGMHTVMSGAIGSAWATPIMVVAFSVYAVLAYGCLCAYWYDRWVANNN